MTSPSLLLLCGGLVLSLAGVWTLAGLSERSQARATPRALASAALGLFGVVAVYQRAPAELRPQLLLPALFAGAAVLALAAGTAKLDGALAQRNAPRVWRRARGLLSGSWLSLAAVGAVSLELWASSLVQARFAWAFTAPILASTYVAFAQRARFAGAAALALGRRGLLWGALVLVALGLMRLALPRNAPRHELAQAPTSESPPPATPSAVPPPVLVATPPTPAVPAAEPVLPPASAAPPAASSPSTGPSATAPGPGELRIESIVSHDMLEADARGGVERRFEKLAACMKSPANQQSGSFSFRVGIDASGSVSYVRPLDGELAGGPLATCALPTFYQMGFAAPGGSGAHFEITLRAAAR